MRRETYIIELLSKKTHKLCKHIEIVTANYDDVLVEVQKYYDKYLVHIYDKAAYTVYKAM